MRWVLVVLVAAALGGAGWVLLGPGMPETEVVGVGDGAERPPQAAPEAEGVTLTGVQGSRGARGAAGTCVLDCRVLRDGRPAAARLEVRLLAAKPLLDDLWRQGGRRELLTPPAPPGPPGPPTASVTADTEGRALVEALAPGGYRVSALAEDGARSEANAVVLAGGARAVVTLELRACDQALEGRVTWSDGRPVAGTLALTLPMPRSATYLPVPTSLGLVIVELGPDGSFRAGGLMRGSHGVRLYCGPSLTVNAPPVVLPTTGPYLLVLDVPGVHLVGRVIDGQSEAPIPGAVVGAWCALGAANVNGTCRSVTGEDGRFDLAVPRFPLSLSVVAAGFGTASRQVAAGGSELTVRLQRVGRVSGRVTSVDGRPASGAVVLATSSGSNAARASATADRDGRYALEEVVPGEALVFVRGGGWASQGLDEVREQGFNPFAVMVASGASVGLDLVAVASARIEGKALDAAGSPVLGASVSASPSSPMGGQGFWRLQQAMGSATASSDAAGAFVIEDVCPGFAYTLNASAPDQPPATAGPVSVGAEGPAHAEIRFPAARWVDVRVVFEGEEAPVADATLQLMLIQGPSSWSGQPGTWTTDRDGRARIGPAGPGELGVTVSGESLVQRGKPVPIEGSKGAPGPFALTVRVARGRTIEGKVLRPDGTPAAGAGVNTQRNDGDGYRWTSAAADGSFTLKGVPSGPVTLSAWLQVPGKPQANASLQVDGGATGVVLKLVESTQAAGAEAIVVRVLDDRGESVRQAQVTLSTPNRGSWGNALSEGVARFEFSKSSNAWILESLTAGTLFVDVSGARGWNDQTLPVGPLHHGPLGADQREVEVRLPAERTIEGRVSGDDGRPVRGVLVRARPATLPSNGASYQGEGRSDEQGRFRVGGLAEGEHTLQAMIPPDFLAAPLPNAAAGAKNVEIRLKRGRSARVRVRDADGKPLEGATVSLQARPPDALTDAQRQEWWQRRNRMPQPGEGVRTAADGAALLRGIDPELPWVLQVSAGREDLRPFAQDRWVAADTEVQLERGYVVSGVVRDPQGRPLANAQVMRRTGENGWSGFGTQQDGTFRLTNLDRGSVSLLAIAPNTGYPNANDPGLAWVTVAAGTENVVLVADPGIELVVVVVNAPRTGADGPRLQAALYTRRGEDYNHQSSLDGQDGRFVFKGVRAEERYALWIAPQGGSEWYGLATEVRGGGGEVRVVLERGGTIRGRIATGGVSYENLSVGAGDGKLIWVGGTVDADGRYEVRGVPPGKMSVYAWGQLKQQYANANAEAQVGDTVDLRLELTPAR